MTAASAADGGARDAPADGHPAVVVEGLTKRYGDRTVLDGVSITVERGELVALLGPNGAGKTTTVEIVEGYRRADGGSVRVLGRDPATGGPQLRARVGLMLQGGGIDPRAQPRETLVQYGRFHVDPRGADELLDLVGLGAVARTRYRRLSGGERQRLGLALALVGRPELLVLDEPTAGMDPEARAVTRSIVADMRAGGAAILLTSHDLGDVERMADRVAILVGGRVIASGTPTELAAGARPRLRFRLDPPLDGDGLAGLGRALAQARSGATLVAGGDAGRYRVEGVAPDAALIAALAAWCVEADRLIVEIARDRRHPRGGLPRARRRCGRPRRRVVVSQPAGSFAATRVQLVTELRLTARRGENVLVTVIVPAVTLVFFASAGILPTAAARPVDFLLPGAMALAVIAASLVNLGIATAYERSYGVLKRLGGSPLTRANLLVAKIGAVLVVEVAQVVLLIAIAWLVLGWRPSAGTAPFLLVVALLLGTVAFAGVGLLLAGALRAEATLALANALFIVALLLGGIILPIDRLPGPLAAIAGLLPAAALSDAFRIGLGSGGDALRPLAILAAWGAGSVALAVRTFRWD